MISHFGLDDPRLVKTDRVLAVGAFDGVHRGHQRLLRHVCRIAADYGVESAIMTFEPIPAQVFRSEGDCNVRLTIADERRRELTRHCVSTAVVVSFDEAFRNLSALDFARRILVERLGVVALIASSTHTFGRHAEADVRRITELGMELGFEVHVLPPILVDGERVNSSQIRRMLWEGNVEEASRWLGRPYDLAGEVVHGRGIGTGLGFPTANLQPVPEKLVPADGVYACAACVENPDASAADWLPAAVSIGNTPTISGTDGPRVVEAHLLVEAPLSLEGRVLRLLFLQRLREQRKFPGADALIAQIARDVDVTREVFAQSAQIVSGW
jgi:riboflavin kinase/FMN adenylyltransferase